MIREVSDRPIASSSAPILDLGGRTLMPGLIDCHVHVVAASANLGQNAAMPNSLVAAHAARIMEGMLRRGFTSVRDAGGADHGLVVAQDSGLIRGPAAVHFRQGPDPDRRPCRLPRAVRSAARADHYADRLGALGRIADGVPEVRRAAREEIKAGARYREDHGEWRHRLADRSDRLLRLFARGNRGRRRGGGECRHLCDGPPLHGRGHPPRRRVRCAIGRARQPRHARDRAPDEGDAARSPCRRSSPSRRSPRRALRSACLPESVAKIEDGAKRGAARRSRSFARPACRWDTARTSSASMHRHQSREFAIRSKVLPAHEIIASATSIAARILGMEGSSARSRPARSPISSSSTATRCRTPPFARRAFAP